MKRALAAVAALLALSACTSSHKSKASSPSSRPSATYTAPPPALPVPGVGVPMSTAPPPWPAPAIVSGGRLSAAYVAAAGLPYAPEMLTVHYHAHLDVVVDGKAVPVPAYLGFVAKGQNVLGLAPLHTHDFSGVIHIENAVPATFVLGQVFTEWGVRFSQTCLGANCTGNGKELAVFVDGKRYTGDPTRLVLAKHQEIAVMYGTAGQLSPPTTYRFPSGE